MRSIWFARKVTTVGPSPYSDRYGSNHFCPYQVAAMLGQARRESRAGDVFSLALVSAMNEFEAWLVAGVEGLRGGSLTEGRGTIPESASFPEIDIEAKRDAKEELLDQASLAANVDLDRVLERCRILSSF